MMLHADEPATALRLGLRLQAVASEGSAAVIALTTLGLGPEGHADERIDALASKVSLSATVLYAIAEKVVEHADGFKSEDFWSIWHDVLDACSDVYLDIQSAVKQLKQSSGRSRCELSSWERLVMAHGGEEKMTALSSRLRLCFQRASAMHQIVHATVLCLVAKRQHLSMEESQEEREIKRNSTGLLAVLSEAGVQFHDPETTETIKNSCDAERWVVDEPSQPSGAEGDRGTTSSRRRISSYSSSESSPPSSTSSLFDNHFEAYYIVPRTISIPPSRGTIHSTKPQNDAYMIVGTDISSATSNHSEHHVQDRNVRRALRRARQVSSSKVTFLDTGAFPQSVHEAMSWLVKTRNQNASGEEWKLVDAVELDCIGESEGMFRRKHPYKTGYLVLLRGRELSLLEIEKSQARKRRQRALSDTSSQPTAKVTKKRKHRRRHSTGTEPERQRSRRKSGTSGLWSRRSASTHSLPLRPKASRVPARSSLRKSGPQYVDSWPPEHIQSTSPPNTDVPPSAAVPGSPHSQQGEPSHHVQPSAGRRRGEARTRRGGDGKGLNAPKDEAWMKIHDLMASFANV